MMITIDVVTILLILKNDASVIAMGKILKLQVPRCRMWSLGRGMQALA